MYVIEFYRNNYIVSSTSLFAFFKYIYKNKITFLDKLGEFIKLLLFFKVKKNNQLNHNVLNKLTPKNQFGKFSWFRYKSDGNILQLFYLRDKVIYKIQKNLNSYLLNNELTARKRITSIAPKIVKYNIDEGVLVEEFLDLYPVKRTTLNIIDIIENLKCELYEFHTVDVIKYIDSFSCFDQIIISKMKEIIQDNFISTLDLTIVHGDLWLGNIFRTNTNNYILVDWEYSHESTIYIMIFGHFCFLLTKMIQGI